MKRLLPVAAFLCCASCAGQKFNNRPADMPGSPAEAEAMQQDNTPDKAPPRPNEEPEEQPDE